jgi:hypothetical protein
MLLQSAIVLLITWLAGVLSVSTAGDAVHVPLLVGLALLLLAFLRAHEETVRRALEGPPEKR